MKINLNRAYIIILLVCLTNFFGFYKFLPLANQLYSVDLMYMYILFFSLLFFLLKAKKLVLHKNSTRSNKMIGYLLLFFFILILIEVIVSYFKYHQGFGNVLKESMYYFIFIIVAFLILNTLDSRSIKPEWLCKRITQISIICSVIAIIVFVSYTYLGVDFLELSESKIRNGTIQYAVGSNLVIISFIISLVKLINKQYSRLDLINLLVGFIQIYFVNKTRSVILYLFIVICLVLLSLKKTNKLIKSLLWFAILGCVVFLIFGNQLINQNINLFINSDYGMLARMDAIEFYMGQFIRNPILGMGFISTKKTLAGWALLYGSSGVFYRGDVGFIGLLNEFGLIGLIWAVLFLVRIYKLNNDNSTYALSVKFIVIYFFVSCLSLSFMDAERLMTVAVPLMIAVILKDYEKMEFLR